jgi:hypothetical protein
LCFGQHLFRSVKSIQICHFPFFFRTITMFANHWGYVTSVMKPASSNHCTSAFAPSNFSSDVLWSFCFLGFTFRLTCSLCSIISTYTHEIRGGPCKNNVVFVEERQELYLFLWTHLSVEAYGSVWYPGVKCHFLEITLGLNGFFEFCRSFFLD